MFVTVFIHSFTHSLLASPCDHYKERQFVFVLVSSYDTFQLPLNLFSLNKYCLFFIQSISKCLTCLQVIAIAMDVFTDVDIFKEIITATLRGVAVYILLDNSHFSSFLAMSRRAGINIQDLKVRNIHRCQTRGVPMPSQTVETADKHRQSKQFLDILISHHVGSFYILIYFNEKYFISTHQTQ